MSATILSKRNLIIIPFILAVVLGACQGTPTSAPRTATPTKVAIPATATSQPSKSTLLATPTETRTAPSETPLPSPTPTVTATAVPRGALTWEQEKRLYEASLRFLAENQDDATIVVRDQIDYLQGNGEDPSLACGPISAVILRDAGLLPTDTDLHEFWLLDPRTRGSQIVLETYFPKDRYAWYQFDTSTIEFDFDNFPLLPGDFIYLYTGINGTFEHIITVSRVDEVGRAYTVSNLATDDGFVIRELMLYDPDEPGVGQFYDWMNRELNGWLGMTGDGGFDLWRPIIRVQDYNSP